MMRSAAAGVKPTSTSTSTGNQAADYLSLLGRFRNGVVAENHHVQENPSRTHPRSGQRFSSRYHPVSGDLALLSQGYCSFLAKRCYALSDRSSWGSGKVRTEHGGLATGTRDRCPHLLLWSTPVVIRWPDFL